MSKYISTIIVVIMTLFAFTAMMAQADAKKAKKAPTQQCKPYGDEPQMCGQTK